MVVGWQRLVGLTSGNSAYTIHFHSEIYRSLWSSHCLLSPKIKMPFMITGQFCHVTHLRFPYFKCFGVGSHNLIPGESLLQIKIHTTQKIWHSIP